MTILIKLREIARPAGAALVSLGDTADIAAGAHLVASVTVTATVAVEQAQGQDQVVLVTIFEGPVGRLICLSPWGPEAGVKLFDSVA
jgi:hypothetical protein